MAEMAERAEARDTRGPVLLAAEAWPAVEARLGAYVRRRVAPGAAEDVVGDVVERLVRHREALATAANPTAWMLRVAANAIADHHRRRAAEARALAEAAAEDEMAATSATAKTDHTAAAELASCLVPMIRSLPAPYGEALMLTEIEGLTQVEAARRLGLSTSGMKSRVQRGRAKLKQVLLRCCTVELDRRGAVFDYRARGGACGARHGCDS